MKTENQSLKKETPVREAQQKAFQWSYTPVVKQKGIYQMLLGDYVRQQQKEQIKE